MINLATVPQENGSAYPQVFLDRVADHLKQRVGDTTNLTHCGVNWVKLSPGSASARRH